MTTCSPGGGLVGDAPLVAQPAAPRRAPTRGTRPRGRRRCRPAARAAAARLIVRNGLVLGAVGGVGPGRRDVEHGCHGGGSYPSQAQPRVPRLAACPTPISPARPLKLSTSASTGLINHVAEARAPLPRAAAGPRARPTSPPGRYLVWSATSPTTACCAGTRRPAAPRRLPPARRATPTATPSTAQGRLVSCEHGNRRVTRTEHDGTITVLADRYHGKRLNSPNDVVVAVRRLDLVHRPRLRHRSPTTRATAPRARSTAATSTGSTRIAGGQPGRRRLRAPERPRLLARRVAALHRRHRRDPRPGRPAPHPRLRRRRRPDACRRRVFAICTRGLVRRLPARRGRPHLDQRPATACTASTRTAR